MNFALSRLVFCLFMTTALANGSDNQNRSLTDNLPSGLHHYRIIYSMKDDEHQSVSIKKTLTLLGCYHSLPLSSLPPIQQSILENLAKSDIIMAGECTNFYHTRKLKRYTEILFNIEHILDVVKLGFFTDYTKQRFFDCEDNTINPIICNYFVKIISTILEGDNRQKFGREINVDIGLIEKLKVYQDEEIVRKMPLRLIYDYVQCYIKHNAVEAELLRLHQDNNNNNNNKALSLDEEKLYFDDEKCLFEDPIPDFSFLSNETTRNSISKFYSNHSWMFSKNKIHDIVPKEVEEKLLILCYLSDFDKNIVLNVAVSKLFIEGNVEKDLRKNFLDNFIDLRQYLSGYFPCVSAQDRPSLSRRNHNWLINKLNGICFRAEEASKDGIAMFGTSHLGDLNGKKDYRGILDFFLDMFKNNNSEWWAEALGKDAFKSWNSLIKIQCIERLDKNGQFNELFVKNT